MPIELAIGQTRSVEAPATSESPPRPAAGTVEAGKPSDGLEASPLDTIWMRDAKGNLVPVVGIPFEEFEQLLRAKKGFSPAAAPAYTLEAVSLVGKANKGFADLQLTATIRVREPG